MLIKINDCGQDWRIVFCLAGLCLGNKLQNVAGIIEDNGDPDGQTSVVIKESQSIFLDKVTQWLAHGG